MSHTSSPGNTMAIPKLPISDFLKGSAAQVAKSAAAADVNRDGKISKDEQARLPQELQDNLRNWQKATGTRVAGVKKFVGAFEPYLTTQAHRADRNKDGFLTRTEAGRLPVDLQDNFARQLAATREATEVAGKTEVELGREALVKHINEVLFNPSAEAGESFRDACLDGSTTSARAIQVRGEMLALANAWNPERDAGGEWEKFEGRSWQAPGEAVWAGRFWQLYTEVKFMSGQQPKVHVEID
jgi:hypothetical protein